MQARQRGQRTLQVYEPAGVAVDARDRHRLAVERLQLGPARARCPGPRAARHGRAAAARAAAALLRGSAPVVHATECATLAYFDHLEPTKGGKGPPSPFSVSVHSAGAMCAYLLSLALRPRPTAVVPAACYPGSSLPITERRLMPSSSHTSRIASTRLSA